MVQAAGLRVYSPSSFKALQEEPHRNQATTQGSRKPRSRPRLSPARSPIVARQRVGGFGV